jgi:hypothetical protein
MKLIWKNFRTNNIAGLIILSAYYALGTKSLYTFSHLYSDSFMRSVLSSHNIIIILIIL